MTNEILLALESIIRDIDKYQQNFYEEFHTNYPNRLNFGRVTIKEIRTNNKIYDEFRSYLDKYTDYIMEVSAFEFNLEEKFADYDVRSRVKTVDAIETKVEHYYRRNVKGSVIVQKCLNDIMGFRVVLTEDIVESEQFGHMIEKLLREKIIFMNCKNKLATRTKS